MHCEPFFIFVFPLASDLLHHGKSQTDTLTFLYLAGHEDLLLAWPEPWSHALDSLCSRCRLGVTEDIALQVKTLLDHLLQVSEVLDRQHQVGGQEGDM